MNQKVNEFKKWDTHHHINPPFYVEYVTKYGHEKVYELPQAKWSEKMMLGWMDDLNLEKAILSISMPGLNYGNNEESRAISRKCNDYMAELIKKHPDRLGAFAAMPLPDVDGAVDELKYALDELKFDGIGLLSNLNYHYLGDKSFEPFYEEANKREAVIYIHPARPKNSIPYGLLNYTYYLKMDTAKTIIDFMRSGYHKKYSKIKFILSHGGGVLPAVFPTVINALKKENPNIEKEFEQWRHQLFADTALIPYADEMLPTTLRFFGANHVVFGTDLCWVPKKYKYFVTKLAEFNASRKVFEDIYINNVKALFSKKKVEYKPFNIQPASVSRKKGNINHHSHVNPSKVVEFIKSKTGLSLDDLQVRNEITRKDQNSMLSMEIPQLWSMNVRDRQQALRLYNETVSDMKRKSKVKTRVLGAIDVEDQDFSIKEIDYCLNQLNMDGICLYVKIVGKKYEDMFHAKLLEKLEQVNVPVVIHPKASDGIPLYNEQYFDAVGYLFSLIYLDHFEHMNKVNYIPTHTGGMLDFLSHAVSTMHYIDPETHAPRIGKVIWELVIKKKELVHDYIKQLKCIY